MGKACKHCVSCPTKCACSQRLHKGGRPALPNPKGGALSGETLRAATRQVAEHLGGALPDLVSALNPKP